ncbi:hypothetical protein FQZ97_1067170 [compost metagenome]
MALQRGLFEPVECLRQVARRALAVVIELAQLVFGLRVAVVRRLLAGGQCVGQVFARGVQRAAAGCGDQQGVAACERQQRQKKQQAAQR